MGYLDEALEKAKAEQKKSVVESAPVKTLKEGDDAYVGPRQTRVCEVDEQQKCKNFVLCDRSPLGMTEEYNMLRMNVTNKLAAQGHNSVVVASPGINEGKTTITINLAISKAKDHGKSVLIVEADLRNPSICKYLGLEIEYGLSDYLTGAKELPELLINPGIPNLSILPAGKQLARSSEHIASPRMKQLANEIKERYADRYIIFDTPPLLFFPEAHIIASYAEGVVLVVKSGLTTSEDFTKAVGTLNGANVLGVILNKMN